MTTSQSTANRLARLRSIAASREVTFSVMAKSRRTFFLNYAFFKPPLQASVLEAAKTGKPER